MDCSIPRNSPTPEGASYQLVQCTFVVKDVVCRILLRREYPPRHVIFDAVLRFLYTTTLVAASAEIRQDVLEVYCGRIAIPQVATEEHQCFDHGDRQVPVRDVVNRDVEATLF